MSFLFANLLYTIIFWLGGALVILINNIVMDIVSLLFQKISDTDHQGQYIVHSNKLGISWNIGIQFVIVLL